MFVLADLDNPGPLIPAHRRRGKAVHTTNGHAFALKWLGAIVSFWPISLQNWLEGANEP
jgi:hypothetical protein